MPKAKAQRSSSRNAQSKDRASSGGASVSRASARSNSAPPPALVRPTRTQLAIRNLLAVDLDTVSFGVIDVIATKHVREMPPDLSKAEQAPEHYPKGCCFDAAGGADPRWTAHELCERCDLFNQIIRVSTHSAYAGIIMPIVGPTIIRTDCDSDTDRTGASLKLPSDVMDIILGHFVQGATDSKDYPSLCKLMHVSSAARYAAAKSFTPISVNLLSQDPCADALRIKFDTLRYFDEAIRWFLADFSVRKHGAHPVMPDYGSSVLKTVKGTQSSNVLCCPPMTLLALTYDNAEEEESTWDEGSNIRYTGREEYVIEEDVCEVTRDALNRNLQVRWERDDDEDTNSESSEGSEQSDEERTKYWANWARFANPYQRALWYEGDYTDPVVGLRLKLKYWLHAEKPNKQNQHPHVWKNAATCNKLYQFEVFSAP